MKRKLLYLVVLAIFTANISFSQYVEDTLTVNKTLVAPLIDGDIDAEWDTEDFYEITEYGEDDDENTIVPDPDDITAQYKMLWDDEYIYFLGVVVDDVVADQTICTDLGAPGWESDSWEFYISPTLSKLPSMEEMGQIRWNYARADAEDGSEATTCWSDFTPAYDMGVFANAERKLSDDGWVLEARVSLAALAILVDDIDAYAAGDLIGWQITVSDLDEAAVRDDIGSWIPDTEWNQADTLGILKLGSKVTGVSQTQVGSSIYFYPNPVADELFISGDASIEAIEIINTVGATVLRRSNVKDVINVSDLHSGIYFVKVYSDGYLRKTHKFFKE